MPDYRTPFEKQLFEVMLELKDLLYSRQPSKEDYVRLRGHLRDVEAYLINRQFGCKTGKHASTCLCDNGLEHSAGFYSHKKHKAA